MDCRALGLAELGEMRTKHMGKRTLMVYDNGTKLLVEGLGLEIVGDKIYYFITD